MMRLRSLCSPANASVLCSDQGIASARHRLSCPGSLLYIAVAVQVNQSFVIARFDHLIISGQVFVRSWLSVLAVTTTLQSSQVDMPQLISIEMNADLPIP